MITSESPGAIVEQFRDAALGLATWKDALRELGNVLDSSIIQLAGAAGADGLWLNHISGASDDMLAAYYAERGYDPAVNPRTRGLLEAAPYACITDDVLVGNRRDAWPIYDFFARTGASHAALVRLRDRDGLMSSLTVMRSAASGAFDDAQLRLLRAIAPGVESAVHAAITLGSAQNHVVIDTAETVSGAVVLLGGDGEIISLSAAAQALLTDGAQLSCRAGRLCVPDAASEAALSRAVRLAALVNGPARQESRVTVCSRSHGQPLYLHLYPLPQRMAGPLSGAQVLLTIRSPAVAAVPNVAALRRAFGFTAAEAEVASLLATGSDPSAIAAARGSSVQTVRSQLKMIYQKTGTHRQAELAILLREIG